MVDESEAAVSRFAQGFNCAQSILSTVGVHYGLDTQQALRVSGAFGGGMARMGETCGAVTGALMVIGLMYGKTLPEDDAAREKTYQVVHQFVDEFKARNGSILCRELLGCDVSTADGSQTARDKHLYTTRCPEYVRISAQILQGLIKEGQA